MKKLTDAKIRKLDTPGLITVDPTLYLRVTDRGKYFVQRIMIRGKRREISIGPFPVMTIDEARETAFHNRRKVRAGIDPIEEKRTAAKPSFEAAALKTLETMRAAWKSELTAKDWGLAMNRYVFPKIGRKRIDLIDKNDVLKILVPLWTTKHETGRRLRGWIKAVFSWAQAHDLIEVNPAGEVIDGALPKGAGKKTNHRALHYSEVGQALSVIDATRASMAAKLCLQFIVFTATRSGEARGATWDEIDMESRVWIIPASRMKKSREHRVPLSDAAMRLLNRAAELRESNSLVFPSPTNYGKPLSTAIFNVLLKSAGLFDKATAHGFRSSFRDWCAETGKPREIAESALAHQVPGVEGAYFRSDLFDRRRLLMDQWAAYVTGVEAKIIKLRKAHR